MPRVISQQSNCEYKTMPGKHYPLVPLVVVGADDATQSIRVTDIPVVLLGDVVALSSIWRCSNGVANVLSTTTGTPAAWAAAHTAARSMTFSSGLVGLSRIRAGECSAMASIAAGSVKSTHTVWTPNLANTCSNMRTVQPYKLASHNTTSPLDKVETTAVIALTPEPNTVACGQPSRRASTSSKGRCGSWAKVCQGGCSQSPHGLPWAKVDEGGIDRRMRRSTAPRR